MNPPLGELAALLTAVCWSFTAIFFGYSGRRVGSGVVNRTRLLIALGLLTLTQWLVLGYLLPQDAGPARWGWLALSAFLGLAVGDGAYFSALVLIGPRLASLIMSAVPVVSVVLGYVLFGDLLTLGETAGIVLTVGAIAWVVAEPRGEGYHTGTAVTSRQFRLGVTLAFVGALGQATGLVASRYALAGNFPSLTATQMRVLVAALMVWAAASAQRQVSATFRGWRDRRALSAIAAGAFVGPFLGVWSSLYAVQHAPLGVATTLMSLPPVLLIPIEYLLHRRRASRRAVAGTVLAIVGVALIVGGG